MPDMRPQLTAEEISRAREKNQKKRERKKQGALVKKLAIHSAASATQESFKAMPAAAEPAVRGTELSWENENCAEKELLEKISRETNEKAALANTGWPWTQAPAKLLTQAPFALNQYNDEQGFFTLPRVAQVT